MSNPESFQPDQNIKAKYIPAPVRDLPYDPFPEQDLDRLTMELEADGLVVVPRHTDGETIGLVAMFPGEHDGDGTNLEMLTFDSNGRLAVHHYYYHEDKGMERRYGRTIYDYDQAGNLQRVSVFDRVFSEQGARPREIFTRAEHQQS